MHQLKKASVLGKFVHSLKELGSLWESCYEEGTKIVMDILIIRAKDKAIII